MSAFRDVQLSVAFAASHLEDHVPVAALARRSRMSPSHFQRSFLAWTGETPKQFAARLRLCRAASLLLTTRESVLDIALSCGYENHETFTRAFRKYFHMAPRAYRTRGFRGPSPVPGYPDLVNRIGACVRLHHLQIAPQEIPLPYSITKIEIEPQPILLVRKRAKRSDISATIIESLGHIFAYTQQHGVALSPGHPLTRYPALGPGMVTMEPAMRIASTDVPTPASPVIVDSLPGGLVATTTHMGPYETLTEAYAALEQWIDAEGFAPAGAPWESYVTDPAEHPDPKDWRTDIFWPIGAPK